MTGLMTERTVVVMGVANKWSIAWGIAKTLNEHGAKLIFTYYGDRSLKSLEKLLEEEGITNAPMIECNVTDDESIQEAFAEIATHTDDIYSLVHSIAFANKDELRGMYMDTSRAGFAMAHDISAYSLVACTKAAQPLMKPGSNVLTLTYLGGEKVVKNYNVMGVAKASLDASVRYLAHDLGEQNIRVNAISAGPIKTLAARGVGGFSDIADHFIQRAPLGRLVNQEEIGNAALFLCSNLGSAVTGEIMHVDCGYSIMGY